MWHYWWGNFINELGDEGVWNKIGNNSDSSNEIRFYAVSAVRQ